MLKLAYLEQETKRRFLEMLTQKPSPYFVSSDALAKVGWVFFISFLQSYIENRKKRLRRQG